MREAYTALVLQELDALTGRVERLPAEVEKAERAMTTAASAVSDAGDRYRAAVTKFNEEATAELTEFLERRAGQVANKTVDEIRGTLIEAAQQAFRSEAGDKAASLGVVLTAALKEFRAASRARYVEHAFTATVAAGLAAGLVWFVK
jgi:uncharacterized protein YPO0396